MQGRRSEQEIFEELAAVVATPGFAHVIAYLCMRDNFTWYRERMRAEDMQHLYSRSRLIRTEMSTLIGLMLRSGADAWSPAPRDPAAAAARAEDLLEELHRSLGGFALDAVLNGDVDNPTPVAWQNGSALREPIFYGGEGAFSFQNCDCAAAKYAADDAWLLAHRGASIGDMIATAKAIATLQTDRVSRAVQAGATTVGDPRLLEAFTFMVGDLVPLLGTSPDTIRACVEAFSLAANHGNWTFGTLSDFNAANASPIMAIGDGRHVLFHFNALAEALYESPFYWLGADRAYASTALRHRGEFTEAFALERLARAFGPARVHRGVNLLRGKGDTMGEIDVLAVFADQAVVLQAKSKRLTLESRKGNDQQLRGDFKSAVQDAYDQAVDCAQALSDPSLRLIVGGIGEQLEIPRPLTQAYPICLVADHYPALAFQTEQFLVTREVAGVAPPLVIDVFTLDVMAEMLDRPLRFLSYLDLRALHGSKVHIHHEITLLGYHLKNNLWLDDEYAFVALEDDFAADLEIAMGARRLGLPGRTTPDGILTIVAGTRLDTILRQIEGEPADAMVDMALQLFQLGGQAMKELRDGVDMFLERARTRGRSDFVMAFGRTGVAIHCNRLPRDEAEQRLEGHMLLRKYSQRAEDWYGLLLSPTSGGVVFGLKVAFPWKRDQVMERALEHLKPTPPRGNALAKAERPTRNGPCHCDSGLKYKKCHLKADEGR